MRECVNVYERGEREWVEGEGSERGVERVERKREEKSEKGGKGEWRRVGGLYGGRKKGGDYRRRCMAGV